jgi:hypothetical protein
MRTTLVADLQRVWSLVNAMTGVPMSSTAKGIGLERDGEIVAGTLFVDWNGSTNIWMHGGKRPGVFLPRSFWRCVFAYPFDEVGVRRVSAWVDSSNMAARRLNEHLGFSYEAVLRDAGADGGPAFIMVMRREDCRPLTRWGRGNDASTAGSKEDRSAVGAQMMGA